MTLFKSGTLAKLLAATLSVLTLLPFTAPFPSFDLRNWSEQPTGDRQTSSAKLLTDGASRHALLSSNPSQRIRTAAVPVSRKQAEPLPAPSGILRPVAVSSSDLPRPLLSALRI